VQRRGRVTVWIQDRPNRFLSLEWHDPSTGKRRSKSSATNDFIEAETARAKLEADLNAGIGTDRSLPWEEFRKRYRNEHLAGLRARSIEKAEMVLDRFEVGAAPKTLGNIDESSLSRFAERLRANGSAPWTIRNYLGALRAAFRWAETQRLMVAPRTPTIRVPRIRPRAVDHADVEKLLAAATPTWRVLLLCGWFAGLRLSEAYQLRRSASRRFPWVDGDTIRLPAAFAKSNEDQSVPVHPELATALAGLPIDTKHKDRYFYFAAQAGDHAGEEITRSGLSHAVGLIARRAGVRVTMHDLRRGFGSRLAATVPPAVLQAAMRHANLATTMGFYVNVDSSVRAAIESLGRGATGGKTTNDNELKSS